MVNTLTVTSLNLYVKSLLEQDQHLGDIIVEGEISNFVNHFKSGHYYFALKDEKSLIKTVMFGFNNKKLTFKPENGMKVLVRGKVSLYEKDGTYQLYATDMFLNGKGLQQLAFEQLKEKLAQEGLFDAVHKKALPPYPFVVGVATSATGAALQDILSVAARRFPCAEIILAACGVQGENAKASIIQAIQKLDAHPKIEVIIIARGGGSKEDMWVFNDEEIARTAFACTKPTISAVGHEIDFSILDFICDVRAATPTAAAELALPDIQSVSYQLLQHEKIITDNLSHKIKSGHQFLQFIQNSKGFHNIKFFYTTNQAQINAYQANMKKLMDVRVKDKLQKTQFLSETIRLNSPIETLSRGYALILKEGQPLRSEYIHAGDNITLRTDKNLLKCSVQTVETIGE